MSQKAATINPAAVSSKKCLHCGLTNFSDTKQCRRCKADPFQPLSEATNDNLMRADAGEGGRSTFRFAWILAAVVVAVLLGLVVLYMRQGSPVTLAATSEASAQPLAAGAEESAPDPAEENARSEAVATNVLAKLKSFQDETERGMELNAYEEKLNQLRGELDRTLPGFSRHEEADETFRQEIAAAVRDHTAAANWWKTTVRNSSVLSDADRKERTQLNWESARTHLTKAEKMLVR